MCKRVPNSHYVRKDVCKDVRKDVCKDVCKEIIRIQYKMSSFIPENMDETPDNTKNADMLIKALENDNNEYIVKLSGKKIEKLKFNALHDLDLPQEDTVYFMDKLREYTLVDEIPDVKIGSYIRWIPLKNPDDLFLTKGGIVCDVNICSTGSFIMCKCHRIKYKTTFIQVNLAESIIFRKLSPQEKLLIHVLDYIDQDAPNTIED